MKKIVEFITKFHEKAKPFVFEEAEGFVLIGECDNADTEFFDYECGRYTLNSKNYISVLNEIIYAIKCVDKLDDLDLLDFESEEINSTLLEEMSGIATCYFRDEETKVTEEIIFQILENHPEVVNNALYYVLDDNSGEKKKKEVDYHSLVDNRDTGQFSDPFIGMSYEVANFLKVRPKEVVDGWQVSEVITFFAKIQNDIAYDNFQNWKSSQKHAPAPKEPKKQVFHFKNS